MKGSDYRRAALVSRIHDAGTALMSVYGDAFTHNYVGEPFPEMDGERDELWRIAFAALEMTQRVREALEGRDAGGEVSDGGQR